MEIIINKRKKISTIQDEFHKRFPFLKIEFYKKAHTEGEGSGKRTALNTEMTIEEVQKKSTSGSIKIHGLMTVAELESAFAGKFGLSVQVFRKSGKIWLQTTTTDNWTLAEQNQEGMDKHENPEDNIIDSMDRQDLE